jgi:hypothetical protein
MSNHFLYQFGDQTITLVEFNLERYVGKVGRKKGIGQLYYRLIKKRVNKVAQRHMYVDFSLLAAALVHLVIDCHNPLFIGLLLFRELGHGKKLRRFFKNEEHSYWKKKPKFIRIKKAIQ